MADNGKKEFPIDGDEEDVNSRKTRKIHKYIINGKRVVKSIKKKMNKRFRKRNKPNKGDYESYT